MDLSAIAKWPDVPACYEWLALDRRGDWRLQGERVTHRGLIDFMNRQYGSDEAGRWFVQNGPQRVYVDLGYTPWVFRRQANAFLSHTGQPAGELQRIFLDDAGNILLATELGIGLLDDRELAAFLSECTNQAKQTADEEDFASLMAGDAIAIHWQTLPLEMMSEAEVATLFSFCRHPRP